MGWKSYQSQSIKTTPVELIIQALERLEDQAIKAVNYERAKKFRARIEELQNG